MMIKGNNESKRKRAKGKPFLKCMNLLSLKWGISPNKTTKFVTWTFLKGCNSETSPLGLYYHLIIQRNLVHFLGDLKTPKFPSEINWPLATLLTSPICIASLASIIRPVIIRSKALDRPISSGRRTEPPSINGTPNLCGNYPSAWWVDLSTTRQ